MRLGIVIGAASLLLHISTAGAQYHDPRALAADPATAEAPLAPVLNGLGDSSFLVSTGSAESQYFFDQGLRLTYAFNHSEALRSFKEAARLDANNAMAWWGQALVLGPNINLPMMPYVAGQAWEASRRAVQLAPAATEREQQLIAALAKRYGAEADESQPLRDQAYARAMVALAEQYPDDPDIATLTASAIMNLSPWDYWFGDGSPHKETLQVMKLLEQAIDQSPEHSGLLHYYIHIVEAQRPYRAEEAADRLRDATPGAGHLLHMPSHIYMRVGRYADAYAVNVAASAADESYIAACQAQGLYPVGYYPHNMHFMVWSAQSMGRYAAAMRAARQIRTKIPDYIDDMDAATTGTGADAWQLFETFLSQPLYTMVRFGDWEAVLEEPAPPRTARFMTGVRHYARGLAYVHTGNTRKARREFKSLRQVLAEDGIYEYPASLNGAGALLEIAAAVLEGEIEAAGDDYDAAIAALSRAVRMQDGLVYMEPPDWFMPTRHYLGAVLLEAGRPAEAETVYWDDLRRNPNNGYALMGLAQAQEARGNEQGATVTRRRFNAAWSEADHRLTSSRF